MNIERPKSKQPIPDNAKKVFHGKIFDVYQWEQELYDGSTTVFEKVKRLDTIVVFPVLDNGNILLTEQVQPGRDPFVDAPSGRVESGEDPLVAVKRELLEETGYEAKEFVLWKTESPATKIDWVVYVFIAKGCMKIREQEVDAGEKIVMKEVAFDELLQQARNKQFRAQEVVVDFLEALLDKTKYEELKQLFKQK